MAARYVRYAKYACMRTQIQNGYSCYQTKWVTVDSGTDANIYLQGVTDYEIVWGDGQYVYADAGEQSGVSAAEPGTVYDVFGTTVASLTVFGSNGSYRVENRKVVTQLVYRYVYSVGALLGAVAASEGAFPEERKGYTYVTTDGAYVIMQDRDGLYYAYLELGR